MTQLGFLSFGHWSDVPGSQTRTGADVLHQAIDLSVAAEELGVDGAFFRVHHFARQHSAPFPLLSAIGARTSRLQIGTGVIDMRYENPLHMAEDAAVADLIADGRLQLGISRGSPEPALAGYEAFGHVPRADEDAAGMARRHTRDFLAAVDGGGAARPDPRQSASRDLLPIQPQAPGLRERIWWGAGSRATAAWAAQQGMNLMSSTLLTEETGQSLADLQAEQIEVFRSSWRDAGWQREPRISVSRSVMPVFDDVSRRYFGVHAQADSRDQVGYIDGGIARFGRSYTGEPSRIAEELAQDAAVAEADLLLVTVPNQLGVDYNARALEVIQREIMPALG